MGRTLHWEPSGRGRLGVSYRMTPASSNRNDGPSEPPCVGAVSTLSREDRDHFLSWFKLLAEDLRLRDSRG